MLGKSHPRPSVYYKSNLFQEMGLEMFILFTFGMAWSVFRLALYIFCVTVDEIYYFLQGMQFGEEDNYICALFIIYRIF